MKHLVTGATGLIGTVLDERLFAEGDEVAVLTRDPDRAKRRLPAAVKAFAWNPTGEPAPRAAFDGVDIVIHLAGEGIAEKRWSAAQKKKILDSRALGTRNLVETMTSL